MKAKIAVATVSGKAYYKLVNELKQRKLPFLSLMPTDDVPLYVKVVITTKKERRLVNHQNILTFEEDAEPATVVDEAVRKTQGKQKYDTIVIGIDPGKTFGLAITGDGNVLETITCYNSKEVVAAISRVLSKSLANALVIKIGDGAPYYTEELIHRLDETLPEEVTIEVVSEAGTSHLKGEITHRGVTRDVMSAIKIAERKGQPFQRRKSP